MRAFKNDAPVCPKCSQQMELVTEIAPLGRHPGLRAFICERCGAVDSCLIDPQQRAA
jgi:uncharacterized Zn finger protein